MNRKMPGAGARDAGTTKDSKTDERRGNRRRFVRVIAAGAAAISPVKLRASRKDTTSFTVVTFGDSILDCGQYNDHRVHPGQLLVRNEDALFPDFAGRDLSSLTLSRLEHRARDGSQVDDLSWQARGLHVKPPAVALLTVGGNDLLSGLAADRGEGILRFARQLEAFVTTLGIRPVLLGTVYDPTFGDDSRNFLGIDARIARANLQRVNSAIEEVAGRHGQLIEVHAHFLAGDPSWYTRTIEPSLRGASEVRAAFLPAVLHAARDIKLVKP